MSRRWSKLPGQLPNYPSSVKFGNPIDFGHPSIHQVCLTTSPSDFLEGRNLDNLKVLTNSRAMKVITEETAQ